MKRSRPNRRRKTQRMQMRAPRLSAVPRIARLRIRLRTVLWPVIAGGAAAAAPNVIDELVDQPVGRIVIESTFQRVTPIQIEAALAPVLDEGFWSLDLEGLRSRLQALAWVDSASLRRTWPDVLVVRVKEHRAAARWRDRGLLNARGELFSERPEHGFPELPRFSGPDGTEREVARVYLALRERLIDAHLTIDTLHLDDRGSWRLVLATGQEVRFGRRDVEKRIDRFFGVAAPALVRDLHRVSYVDLRYTNGFAVGWRDDTEAEETDVAARRELAVRSGGGGIREMASRG
jgi:cell division protein FtsQ